MAKEARNERKSSQISIRLVSVAADSPAPTPPRRSVRRPKKSTPPGPGITVCSPQRRAIYPARTASVAAGTQLTKGERNESLRRSRTGGPIGSALVSGCAPPWGRPKEQHRRTVKRSVLAVLPVTSGIEPRDDRKGAGGVTDGRARRVENLARHVSRHLHPPRLSTAIAKARTEVGFNGTIMPR